MPSKGVTSAAHRGPAQTFENFRAVEQMGRTSPELSKSRYYSWIPCRYIGNFNLAGVCSLRAENCQKCTGERQQDSRELVVKSLDEVWGVFPLTYQWVLMGLLGDLIQVPRGAHWLLPSCVHRCRCQFMVSYWHWNSFVLCCLCCPRGIVCLFSFVNMMSRASEDYGECKGCSGNGCNLFCCCIALWIFVS